MREADEQERIAEVYAATRERIRAEHGEHFLRYWQSCMTQELYCEAMLDFLNTLERAGLDTRMLNHARKATRRMRDEQLRAMVVLGELDERIVAEEIGRQLASIDAIKRSQAKA